MGSEGLQYVQLSPKWLEEQIAATKAEIESWPQWMRDFVNGKTADPVAAERARCVALVRELAAISDEQEAKNLYRLADHMESGAMPGELLP